MACSLHFLKVAVFSGYALSVQVFRGPSCPGQGPGEVLVGLGSCTDERVVSKCGSTITRSDFFKLTVSEKYVCVLHSCVTSEIYQNDREG